MMVPEQFDSPLRPTAWRAYRPFVWVFAVASVTLWLFEPQPLDARGGLTLALLVVLGNLADLAAVRIQRGMRVSAAHFAAPFAIIAVGVPGGMLAAIACLASRLIRNRRDWNTFDVAVNIAATSVAGTAWVLSSAVARGDIVTPAVMTVVTFALARTVINLGWSHEARVRGIAIPAVSMPIGRLMLAATVLFTPAIALFRVEQDHPVAAVMLLVLPFVATQFLIRAYGREHALRIELAAANLSITETLVNALDARDPYSAGHSIAVAVYSRDIAAEIGLEPPLVHHAYLAGLLHDIGKIAVPDAILRKPAALTDEEFEEIRLHPSIGEQILISSIHLREVLPGVRHHHERIDGKGYPDRLRDAEIPLQARIIAVADAYNAMTSQRPYRDAMSPELAQRVLVQSQGLQHDPFIVSAFRRVLAARGPEYAIGRGTQFDTSRELCNAIRLLESVDDIAA